ncbi:hypothetical protein AB1Y20_020921 [Prymnesium parvum]|uniref:Translin-associated factor X-interacting protein 1 N-terminal domain-containing protein n=1 Tax=Prymnesium parvum TaxID=97485 RepID=A0AB34JGW3_PRYPA
MATPPLTPRKLAQYHRPHASPQVSANLQLATARKLQAAGILPPQTHLTEWNAARSTRPASARSASARPEPELLTALLQFVRLERSKLEGEPSAEQQLEVLRAAFELFIASFGAYAPLLTAVKHAYDEALAYERARARGVEELSSRLTRMQGETQQARADAAPWEGVRELLGELREEARLQAAAMQADISDREERLAAKEMQVHSAELEAHNLRNELFRSKRARDDLEARVSALAGQVDYWQAEVADARRKAQNDNSEVERLRMEMKEYEQREQIVLQAQRRWAKIGVGGGWGRMGEGEAGWRRGGGGEERGEAMERRAKYQELEAELETWRSTSVRGEQHAQLVQSLATTKAQLKATQADVKEKVRLAARGELTAGFPEGLQWAAESLGGVPLLDPAWSGKRTAEIIALLVGQLVRMHERLGRAAPPAALAAFASASRPPLPPHAEEIEAEEAEGEEGEGEEAALVQCEEAEAREAGGTSFGGYVVVRPELWRLEETRETIRLVWAEYRREGGTLEARLRSQLGAAGHAGILCAQSLNLEAACWRHRAREPQEGRAAMFLMVLRGWFPVEIFAELHKILPSHSRSSALPPLTTPPLTAQLPHIPRPDPLSSRRFQETLAFSQAVATLARSANRAESLMRVRSISLTELCDKLPTLLPFKSAEALAVLQAKLKAEATAQTVPLLAVAPSSAEPCAQPPPTGFRLAMQQQFLLEALLHVNDLRTALERVARDMAQAYDAAAPMVSRAAVRMALRRVDAALAEEEIQGATPARRGGLMLRLGDAPPPADRPAEAAEPTDRLAVLESDPMWALDDALARLTSGPLRRCSRRTSAPLCDKVISLLQKKVAARRAKLKDARAQAKFCVATEMVSVGMVAACVQLADEHRVPSETKWLAAECVARAGGAEATKCSFEAFCQQLRRRVRTPCETRCSPLADDCACGRRALVQPSPPAMLSPSRKATSRRHSSLRITRLGSVSSSMAMTVNTI